MIIIFFHLCTACLSYKECKTLNAQLKCYMLTATAYNPFRNTMRTTYTAWILWMPTCVANSGLLEYLDCFTTVRIGGWTVRLN